MKTIDRYRKLTTGHLLSIQNYLCFDSNINKINGLKLYHERKKYHIIDNILQERKFYVKVGGLSQWTAYINIPGQKLEKDKVIEFIQCGNHSAESGIIREIKDMDEYLLYFIELF